MTKIYPTIRLSFINNFENEFSFITLNCRRHFELLLYFQLYLTSIVGINIHLAQHITWFWSTTRAVLWLLCSMLLQVCGNSLEVRD